MQKKRISVLQTLSASIAQSSFTNTTAFSKVEASVFVKMALRNSAC